MAKITLSIIKADIGSIGGHIQPSKKLVRSRLMGRSSDGGDALMLTFFRGRTGGGSGGGVRVMTVQNPGATRKHRTLLRRGRRR